MSTKADTKCHICGTPIICNSKDGCRESPTHHSHYQVTWGSIKAYGGWADITVCRGHSSHEISEWLQRKVDTPDTPTDREKLNNKEMGDIMQRLRWDAESIGKILDNDKFHAFLKTITALNSDNKSRDQQ
jgi:hypothetical protein